MRTLPGGGYTGVRVGTIAHIDHGKTSLAATVARFFNQRPIVAEQQVGDLPTMFDVATYDDYFVATALANDNVPGARMRAGEETISVRVS